MVKAYPVYTHGCSKRGPYDEVLDVPYDEKDEAKARGARWDSVDKVWYVPDGWDLKPFERWLIRSLTHIAAQKVVDRCVKWLHKWDEVSERLMKEKLSEQAVEVNRSIIRIMLNQYTGRLQALSPERREMRRRLLAAVPSDVWSSDLVRECVANDEMELIPEAFRTEPPRAPNKQVEAAPAMRAP